MTWIRAPALGALSTDIIPADRRTVWQPGVTYNGGITNRTTVFTTLTPIGGGSDDTAAIQAACNACPAGQVVAFSAGTFIVNSTVDLTNCPNITLRGAGPGTGATGGNLANDSASVLVGGGTGTFLNKANRLTDTSNIIINIGHGFQDFLTSINFAADVAVGARSCTVVSSPGVSVGDFVFIDEDTTNEPDVFWGLTNQPPGNPHRGDFGRLGRSLTQVMRVTAVSGNTVTFETPFHHTFTVANNAQLTPYSVAPQFTVGVGVEDMCMMGGNSGNGNLNFSRAYKCWCKHIESYWSNGGHVHMGGSYQCEARDSYFHETPIPAPGGSGYLFSIYWGASDNLVENCIMWNGDKVITMQLSGGGNVVGYCYMDDAWINTNPDLPEAGVNAGHWTTPHMELLEGNYSHEYKGDCYWGNSIDITVLRNHFSGLRAAHGYLATYKVSDGAGGLIHYGDWGGMTGRNCVDVQTGSYRHNFVGNVLGMSGQSLLAGYTDGTHTQGAQTTFVYETYDSPPDNAPTPLGPAIVSMWVWGSEQYAATWAWVPTASYHTHLRQGNWDWFTGTQTWYHEPISAVGWPGDGTPRTIRDSYYITTGIPPFFTSSSYSTRTWPWVNPFTGTTYTLPAKARFDAGTPNTL